MHPPGEAGQRMITSSTQGPSPSGAALRIAMVAGEPSGDLLAASVLRRLHADLPSGTSFSGIGGPRMLEAGFDSHFDMSVLTVNGYLEVLKHIPEILKIRRSLAHQLLVDPPSVFVGVDAPDFNFALEEKLRRSGVPTVHFVSPSIWAWRGGRIKRIARAVDHMLCVFPFEAALYEKAGIAATYVGHPLADSIPLQPDKVGARGKLGLPQDGPVVAVLPGSRRSEIERIGPVFFAAMALMQQREPSVRFVMPAATSALHEVLKTLALAHPQLTLTITDGGSHPALEASDAVLIKSGTSTLEAALYKKPMVISYKVPWLTGQIMKHQGYLPYVGLPNILAGRFVVPEILQDFATPQALADATLRQLNDDANRRSLEQIFSELHQTLRHRAGERAAEVIASVAAAGKTR
jgi:lipid-A-disaccharide synthase